MFTVFFATPDQVWKLRNLQGVDEVVREFTDLRVEQTTQLNSTLAVILQSNRFIAACEDIPLIDGQVRRVHYQCMYPFLRPDLRERYREIFNRSEFRYVR